MSITAKGSKSIRKVDLASQKTPALGFQNTMFFHKAGAGETGISIYALTMPPELTALGFTQASVSDLAAANLLFYKKNISIISSARGPVPLGMGFDVTTSARISFNGFTSLAGEVFTCQINPNSKSGVNVVDSTPINATGPLAAGVADFNVGQAFEVNKYPSSQVGAVLVYMDGLLQSRNTGNSSTTLDGNYYEVLAGGGLGNIIRFNQVDLTSERDVKVVSNGMNSERPDGSMMAVIEGVNGKLNNMGTYVAALAGQALSTVLGGTPTNVDLKSFGDSVASQGTRLTTAEANIIAATTPTSMSDVQATRMGYKTYLSGTNYNSSISPTVTGTNWTTTRGAFIPYQMQDGSWRMKFNLRGVFSAGVTAATVAINGITFGVGVDQAIAGWQRSSTSISTVMFYGESGSSNIVGYVTASATPFIFSGDVELTSKPTWAY
jgi:hypothetical protein